MPIAIALFFLSQGTLLGQAGTLNISSGNTVPGGTVTLSVSLTGSTTSPAGLQWTIAYPASQVSSIAEFAGPAATAAGKSLYCSPGSGYINCLITGLNTSLIPPGIVATIQVTLAPTAGTTTLAMGNSVGVDGTGSGLTVANGTSGIISVPTISSLTCNPVSLSPSVVSSCTVSLSSTAPTGGASVTLGSNNALLTVPASVTVASGATTATFSATAGASIPSNQNATVTATLGSSSKTVTIALQAPVLVSSVSCAPASLGQSAASTCTVTLSQTAPGGGASVTLGSNNALLTVPASVTVASGATTATFSATAPASIPTDQNATVTATLGSSSQTATIALQAPVLVSSVSCVPTSLGQSATGTCTVTLTHVARTGGASVTLGSNNALLTVPASVTVASGATTATFSATVGASIPSDQNAIVTATLGSSSQVTTVALQAPNLILSLACTPASLNPGAASTCTITLSQTAGAGGASVALGSNNALLTVPAAVTVASGATIATFSATAGSSIPSNQNATITGTLGTSSQTTTVSLQAPVLVSGVGCAPTSLGETAISTCTVTLSQTAPGGGASVTLGSNNALLTVPASVTVASGATTAT
ncbi:MAG TPA: hypothetical protein VHA37_05990, partial [Candidatus Saccharimonadales bacterium]|nr:hypothetical protein [Candidatus Saccharimonadales bacterium]